MSDTRKDKRAPVSLKVRFKSATVDEFIEHYCKDVSRGGIFIKSGQPMPVGTLLKFQFQLKDESALIKGVGRVVWTRSEDRAAADQPAGMGIKFIKMDNESRAMVERILEAHSEGLGAFEEGQVAGGAGDSEAPPKSGSFFPDLPPAELPPPEDRTAVRQAAQFLAAALSDATDEAASREAEQTAEEARRRTAQIEAQRIAEAEQRKKPSQDALLPSIMIDPALSEATDVTHKAGTAARAASSAEGPASAASDSKKIPQPAKLPVAAVGPAASKVTRREAVTTREPTPLPHVPSPVMQAPAKRSAVLPVVAIAAVLGVAAFVALRGGPEQTDATNPGAVAEAPVAPAAAEAPVEGPAQPTVEALAAPMPEPTPAEPTAPAPDPTAAANPTAAASAVAPTTAPVQAAAAPAAKLVPLKVNTLPAGAEVRVDGSAKGTAPVTLELLEASAITISAVLPGHATATRQLTPGATNAPVTLALAALPYLLHVETTPPGASILVASKRGTSPADLALGHGVKTIKLTATLPGHEPAHATLRPEAFVQGEDAMRATVSLTLTALPPKPVAAPAPKPLAAKPKPVAPAEPATAEPTSPEPVEKPQVAAPAPAAEPAPAPSVEAKPAPVEAKPAPAPAEPKPAPTKPEAAPEAKPENIPDNPFG